MAPVSCGAKIFHSGSNRSRSLDNDKEWKCCFCCHVRTGAIVIGAVHMALHSLLLMGVFSVLLEPQIWDSPSASGGQDVGRNTFDKAKILNAVSHINRPTTSDEDLLDDDTLSMAFFVILSTSIITSLFLYGAIKGKAAYLLPFFCMEIFGTCAISVTAMGCLLLITPCIRTAISQDPEFPMKDELADVDPSLVLFSTFIGVMLLLALNFYCVWIIWKYYKYLLVADSDKLDAECGKESEDDLPTYSEVVLPLAEKTETKNAA